MPLGEGKDFGGDLQVRMRVAEGRVRTVDVRSTRPADAARVFQGRPPAEAVKMMSMLFSLCGRAQTVAALGAVEAALGQPSTSSMQSARDILRLSEMLSQTAMRVCLDWPRLLELPMRADVARACLGAERAFERALFGGADWKVPGGADCVPDGSAVRAQADDLARLVQCEVTDGLAGELRDAVSELKLEGFGAPQTGDINTTNAPNGIEDGALKRRWNAPGVKVARDAHGAGLLARLEARLADLDALPQEILAAADALAACAGATHAPEANGTGEATVETARGPLIHRVKLQAGRIDSYAIDAPTDANFAADGVVALGLADAAAPDMAALKRAAELHVMAVDPCVTCSVAVEG